MSFPALKNPADYERYKAIYLQTLQQQINNNAINYNANVLYLKTGQLPITPTDTRSIEDKFADTIGIQVQLRALVRQITDNDNTNDIMDDLIKDPPLMVFALQNFPIIKEFINKNYSMGIMYPIFIAHLRGLFRERGIQYVNPNISPPSTPQVPIQSTSPPLIFKLDNNNIPPPRVITPPPAEYITKYNKPKRFNEKRFPVDEEEITEYEKYLDKRNDEFNKRQAKIRLNQIREKRGPFTTDKDDIPNLNPLYIKTDKNGNYTIGKGLLTKNQKANHLRKVIMGEIDAGNTHPQLKVSLKKLNNYLKK